MRINWIKVVKNGKSVLEHSFEDKNAFFMDNNDGKTLIVSYLLWVFGISYDISKENQRDSTVAVSVSHNGEEVLLKRSGKIFLGFHSNKENILSKVRSTLFKDIFNIFKIQYIDTNLSSLFKSLMNPGVILQSSPYKDNGYLEFNVNESNDVNKYIYWANSFRDEFKMIEMYNLIEEHRVIMKDLAEKIKKKKKILDLLSENEWTGNDDERILKLERKNSEINNQRKSLIELISKKSDLEYKNKLLTKNSDFAKFWRDKYKGMNAVIDGKKFTISDFLTEFSTDDKSLEENIKEINEVDKNKEIVEVSIEVLKNQISEIKSRLNRDFIVIRNADTTRLEKELFDLSSKCELSKDIKAANSLKIKQTKQIDVASMLGERVENFNEKVNSSNQTGKYSWLKINLKSKTGSSPLEIHLGLLESAIANNGLDTPFIFDSPLEALQVDRVDMFVEKIKNISKDNQVIIFTNKRGLYKKFEDWNNSKKLSEEEQKSFSFIWNLH